MADRTIKIGRWEYYPMKKARLKAFLDEKLNNMNPWISSQVDPIQIPHSFTQKEDIEISGFLAATIAWGNRKSIINNAQKMMELMDHAPYDFILHHQKKTLERLRGLSTAPLTLKIALFCKALKYIYHPTSRLGSCL